MIGRTLGFNLKQFDFKKDLEELDISDTDNEEVEVILGNNNYKYARFFRKTLRLTKYFILENKFFVIAVGSILALGLSLSVFMSINVYSVNYNENQRLINLTVDALKEADASLHFTGTKKMYCKSCANHCPVQVFMENGQITSIKTDGCRRAIVSIKRQLNL